MFPKVLIDIIIKFLPNFELLKWIDMAIGVVYHKIKTRLSY